MKYRVNQKNNDKLSLLGFGAMRFPMNENGRIDVDEAVKMVRYAIDNGVNYLDTAYIYQDGQSEETLKIAMEDGYREKVSVATKLPFMMMEKAEDMQTAFDVQMGRLGVDCIDYYLIHDINDASYEKYKNFDVLSFMKEKRAEGKITNIGFSYHGEKTDLFKEIIDSYDWDFCQIQLNYMDAENQAGVAGLKYAASKGIPVIIMEPIRGGKLTDIIPDSIQAYWDTINSERTPAEWALRWVANFPEVTTILSGMSTMEQVVENVQVLSDAEADSLSEH